MNKQKPLILHNGQIERIQPDDILDLNLLDAPILDNPALSINGGVKTKYTISNYNPNAQYIITADSGIISDINRDTFYYTPPNTATTAYLFISYKEDNLISKVNKYSIAINAFSSDGILINNNFENNENYNDGFIYKLIDNPITNNNFENNENYNDGFTY